MFDTLFKRNLSIFLATAFLAVILDQVSKALVVNYLNPGDSVSVIPGLLRITYSTNTGGAFGILQGSRHVIFFAAICVLIIIIVLFFKIWSKERKLYSIAAGLMIGGAFGNLIDRLTRGKVIDFLDLRWWAIFNVADMAIVAGVLLFIVVVILDYKETGVVPGG
ncbi:MAG: signal peptidase II [Actinobacteria bacterium]|nr:signal peptidase II [Actinomycetota bacterium]